MANRGRVHSLQGRSSKELVVFARLPVVLRYLRGRRSLREVARGTGLAAEHLSVLEERVPRKHGSRTLSARKGQTPRLDTLDVLLRYYGVSLSELGSLLVAAQASDGPASAIRHQRDEELAQGVAVLRTLSGLSQASLARAAGVRASTLSDYVRGRKTIPADVLGRLLKGMGFELTALQWIRAAARVVLEAREIGEGSQEQRATLAAESVAVLVRLLLSPSRVCPPGQIAPPESEGELPRGSS
jgi:transcriptional regulator with XRE-family HTH domain